MDSSFIKDTVMAMNDSYLAGYKEGKLAGYAAGLRDGLKQAQDLMEQAFNIVGDTNVQAHKNVATTSQEPQTPRVDEEERGGLSGEGV